MNGFHDHDHTRCITQSLASAEARAAADGLRLTKIRRRVLEILLEEHRALGAYDILDRLQKEGHGGQPPVAYRALDFLTKAGFAHRIERLNAYIACTEPDAHTAPIFMICKSCDTVTETASQLAGDSVAQTASQANFSVEAVAIEAEGICGTCASKEDPA